MDTEAADVVRTVAASIMQDEGGRTASGFESLPLINEPIPGSSRGTPPFTVQVDPAHNVTADSGRTPFTAQTAAIQNIANADGGRVPWGLAQEERGVFTVPDPSGTSNAGRVATASYFSPPASMVSPQPPTRPTVSDQDLNQLRMLLPNLANMSDYIMRNTDVSSLVELNKNATPLNVFNVADQTGISAAQVAAAVAAAAALMPGQASQKDSDPGQKMANNLDTLRQSPQAVAAGLDDRVDILHAGRFLPGAVCSAKKLWKEARKVIGVHGHIPLATYDMSASGLGGCCTMRGLYNLASPGCLHLQINQFCAMNMGTSAGVSKRFTLSDGDNAINIGDSMKDIMDMTNLRQSVRALRTAARHIMPWNFAYEAIDGFLETSAYGAELAGRADRVSKLVDFINHILGLNANAWWQGEDFLITSEIKAAWTEFLATHNAAHIVPVAALDGMGGYQHQQDNFQRGRPFRGRGRGRGGRGGFRGNWNQFGGGGQAGGSAQPAGPGAPLPNMAVPPPQGGAAQAQGNETICRRYNAGVCPNHHSSCFLSSGTRAMHWCDALNSQGNICKGYHMRHQHR